MAIPYLPAVGRGKHCIWSERGSVGVGCFGIIVMCAAASPSTDAGVAVVACSSNDKHSLVKGPVASKCEGMILIHIR